MPVLKPRTRVVYFRISEDEYCELNRLCEAQGARSLSDMARDAMRGLLNRVHDSEPSGVTVRLDSLEKILQEITESLRCLSAAAPDKAEVKEYK